MASTTPALDTSPLTEVADALANARNTLAAQVGTLARTIRDQNPMSRRFVGFIREYRYTAGRKGEMPSHRFYLECGNGVWIYARVPSSAFERIMADMEVDFANGTLDDQMIVCEADRSINAIVPVEFVQPFDPMMRDRFNNYLYMRAPVLCDSDSKVRTGSVDGRESDYIRVRLDEGDTAFNFLPENVARAY